MPSNASWGLDSFVKVSAMPPLAISFLTSSELIGTGRVTSTEALNAGTSPDSRPLETTMRVRPRSATLSPSIGNTCLTDYPSLGIDANALYMGGDEFCPSFQQTDGFVIRKSSVLGVGPIVVTTFRALMTGPSFVGPFAPRGVDNPDPTSNEGYFIGVDGNSFGTLDMYRISDPGGTPGISANIPITVPATSNPLTVPHLGNTGGTNGNVDAFFVQRNVEGPDTCEARPVVQPGSYCVAWLRFEPPPSNNNRMYTGSACFQSSGDALCVRLQARSL